VDLLPGAIQGADAPQRLAEALAEIDHNVDWQATLQPLIRAVFNVDSRDQIPPEAVPQFWRRLSNSVAKLAESSGVLMTDEILVAGLAFGFDGAATQVVTRESPAAEGAAEEPPREHRDPADA
jgi:hypothetical protein